jgi:hypothetical protein
MEYERHEQQDSTHSEQRDNHGTHPDKDAGKANNQSQQEDNIHRFDFLCFRHLKRFPFLASAFVLR